MGRRTRLVQWFGSLVVLVVFLMGKGGKQDNQTQTIQMKEGQGKNATAGGGGTEMRRSGIDIVMGQGHENAGKELGNLGQGQVFGPGNVHFGPQRLDQKTVVECGGGGENPQASWDTVRRSMGGCHRIDSFITTWEFRQENQTRNTKETNQKEKQNEPDTRHTTAKHTHIYTKEREREKKKRERERKALERVRLTNRGYTMCGCDCVCDCACDSVIVYVLGIHEGMNDGIEGDDNKEPGSLSHDTTPHGGNHHGMMIDLQKGGRFATQ